MLKVFIGFDPRQPVSYGTLAYSIISRCNTPISITPLVLETLPELNGLAGLTPFTYSRFLVPYLCGFEGQALFLDADILLLSDISKLFDFLSKEHAVCVRKSAPIFEWASVMLFNCDQCKMLTPDYIKNNRQKGLHTINWVDGNDIGDIPLEWNYLIGYDSPIDDPKLLHFTQGIPAFPETMNSDYAPIWMVEREAANFSVSWQELMGPSVHAAEINGFKVPIYNIDKPNKCVHKTKEHYIKYLLSKFGGVKSGEKKGASQQE